MHPTFIPRTKLPIRIKTAVYVMSTLAALFSVARVSIASSAAETASTAPVAFVYVSYTPAGDSANKITAFAAAANGKLTVVPGSPFVANVNSMAVTGKYLFGSNRLGIYVASFRILSNGALKWMNSKNVAQYNTSGCIYPGSLVLDHGGATLYRSQLDGSLCESSQWQSFTIDKTTGRLAYLGASADTFLWDYPLSFIGNNNFAYGSQCINYRIGFLDTFTGYRRHTGGLLDVAGSSASTPTTKDPNDFYCRSLTAADPTNHVAVSMTDTNFNDPYTNPHPPQLATYTADSSGNLTTTSTWENMPATEVTYVSDLAMSRSGKLLAVAGNGGLQVFHFNGSRPITHYTGLLTTDSISQMFWDNNNHLYALSQAAGKLYVFTVTPSSAAPASGSPYPIPTPSDLIVQPRTDSDGDWDND